MCHLSQSQRPRGLIPPPPRLYSTAVIGDESAGAVATGEAPTTDEHASQAGQQRLEQVGLAGGSGALHGEVDAAAGLVYLHVGGAGQLHEWRRRAPHSQQRADVGCVTM